MKSPYGELLWMVLTFLGCLLIALGIAQLVEGVPLPPPRPPKAIKEADLVGEWEITWCGGKGACHLRERGAYYAVGWGEHWQGRWSLVGRKLTIEEWVVKPDGTQGDLHIEWTAILEPGKRSGLLTSGQVFRLDPLPKAKPDA